MTCQVLKGETTSEPLSSSSCGDAKAVPQQHTRTPPLPETGVGGRGLAQTRAAPAWGIIGTTKLGLDQFPKKLTPLLPPLPADSSVNMAGFSQFTFLFAFSLVPLEES